MGIDKKEPSDFDLREGFVITCDSQFRHFRVSTLVMVDRRIDKAAFWRPSMFNALVLQTREHAEEICSKIKYNRPRVVPYREAEILVEEQRTRRFRQGVPGTQAEVPFHNKEYTL